MVPLLPIFRPPTRPRPPRLSIPARVLVGATAGGRFGMSGLGLASPSPDFIHRWNSMRIRAEKQYAEFVKSTAAIEANGYRRETIPADVLQAMDRFESLHLQYLDWHAQAMELVSGGIEQAQRAGAIKTDEVTLVDLRSIDISQLDGLAAVQLVYALVAGAIPLIAALAGFMVSQVFFKNPIDAADAALIRAEADRIRGYNDLQQRYAAHPELFQTGIPPFVPPTVPPNRPTLLGGATGLVLALSVLFIAPRLVGGKR